MLTRITPQRSVNKPYTHTQKKNDSFTYIYKKEILLLLLLLLLFYFCCSVNSKQKKIKKKNYFYFSQPLILLCDWLVLDDDDDDDDQTKRICHIFFIRIAHKKLWLSNVKNKFLRLSWLKALWSTFKTVGFSLTRTVWFFFHSLFQPFSR